MTMQAKDKICVALDIEDLVQIKNLVEELQGKVGWFKVNSAFTKNGPQIVEYLNSKNGNLFLDLKFHDIPNTVANYAAIATEMGVGMFNVHALGGFDMMQAAVAGAEKRAAELNIPRPKIIAVTVLTSMDQDNLKSISINNSVEEQVLTLASLAKSAGLDGVVASAQEAKLIRAELGNDFLIVTPGIRPKWSVTGDQKRILTPKQAVEAGADILVIGRPITGADDKANAALKICSELAD